MIVLDYPKITSDLSLSVPPFHTGHLGLIPETPVTVGMMAPFVPNSTSCELVISPLDLNRENIIVLTCTLRDDIGVVGRLVNAISDLRINIVAQESTVLNHLNHHFVNLYLDLSTSNLIGEKATDRMIKHYAEYETLLPLHDSRYIEIFESVLAHCADVISEKEVSGRYLPQLQIRPISKRSFRRTAETFVEREKELPYHIKIPLPDTIKSLLPQILGTLNDQPLSYLLMSDTEERTLRAFFPTKEVADKFVHIGFYHEDIPGALSALLRLLARARFNIVTGLLRKHERSRNVWEAVLEYRGERPMPGQDSTNTDELCQWLVERMVEVATANDQLHKYKLDIGLPNYPRSTSRWRGKIGVSQQPPEVNQSDSTKTTAHELKSERENMLNSRLDAIAKLPIDQRERERYSALVHKVQEAKEIRDKPKLFMSYPKAAEQHAFLVQNRLASHFQIVNYMVPDGETIVDEVIKRILTCSFFIGIWHHDENLPTLHGKYNISPWLPFEYGIAKTANLHAIVIHSERLDERIWKRIDPGIGNPEYSDLYFLRTLDTVEQYCLNHMKQLDKSTAKLQVTPPPPST